MKQTSEIHSDIPKRFKFHANADCWLNKLQIYVLFYGIYGVFYIKMLYKPMIILGYNSGMGHKPRAQIWE